MRLIILTIILTLTWRSSIVELPSTNVNYAYIWGKSYQTDNCPKKNKSFRQRVAKMYGKAYKEDDLREITKVAASRYKDLGYNPLVLAEFLYRIALHESNGGQYTKQINGPAISWFQIEPTTALNLVKKHPELIKGTDTKHLASLSKADIASLLERRQDIAASIAIAKIIETGERLGTNKGLKL